MSHPSLSSVIYFTIKRCLHLPEAIVLRNKRHCISDGNKYFHFKRYLSEPHPLIFFLCKLKREHSHPFTVIVWNIHEAYSLSPMFDLHTATRRWRVWIILLECDLFQRVLFCKHHVIIQIEMKISPLLSLHAGPNHFYSVRESFMVTLFLPIPLRPRTRKRTRKRTHAQMHADRFWFCQKDRFWMQNMDVLWNSGIRGTRDYTEQRTRFCGRSLVSRRTSFRTADRDVSYSAK